MNAFLASMALDNPKLMLAYLPHGIHKPAFASREPTPEESKLYDVLLFGSTNEKVYPLRAAAQKATKLTTVLRQLRHPGYGKCL